MQFNLFLEQHLKGYLVTSTIRLSDSRVWSAAHYCWSKLSEGFQLIRNHEKGYYHI